MATNYVPVDIKDGFQNATSLNANFAAIQAALEDALSRKGGSPNQLEAEIDVNSQRLLNLPDPTSPGEPVTLRYLLALPGAVTPPVGVDNPMPMDLDMDNLYKVVNAVNPTQPQDYVTLDYFDNNNAGSAGGGPIDADTLDGFDSGAPSSLVGPAVVTRDVNGDIWARRVNLSAASVAAVPTRVAVEVGSTGEIVWQTLSQFLINTAQASIPQVTIPQFSLTLPLAGVHQVSHGLGGKPAIVQVAAVCTTNDGNFVVGDTVMLSNVTNDSDESAGAVPHNILVKTTNTTVDLRVLNGVQVLDPVAVAMVTLTPANWNLEVRCIGLA